MQLTVTGHRPHHLDGGYSEQTRRKLVALATRSLEAMAPAQVISGMAQGWDQACAEAANALGLPWTAILPGLSGGHTQDMHWPRVAQDRYLALLGTAANVVWLPFPGAGREYAYRDQALVERGDWVLALWNGSQSLTTIRMARERRLPIWNVWEEWNAR